MFGITQHGQLTLGELIDWLEQQDPDQEVRDGFGSPHSERSDYSELAFDTSPLTTFGRMLKHAKSADGATFDGWKGGRFTMDRRTPVYIGEWGDSGTPISELTLAIWGGREATSVAELRAERDRLRALVADAYREGFGDGWLSAEAADAEYTPLVDDWWEESDTRAALEATDET